ncbi:MAG: energy transducer TonB [Bacteroidota bacterium]
MKQLFYLLAITFSCSSSGQNLIKNYEIGSYVDYNKKIISGYYDFDYEPKTSLDVSYNVNENFTTGYYLSNDGLKINGLLKYSPADRVLLYKTNKEAFEKSIKADEVKGYVIGVDTFSVVKNVLIMGTFGDKFSDKSEFAENIENVAGMQFYKFTAQSGNGAPYIRYIVKSSETSDFETFPSNTDKFVKMAADIFKSDPVLRYAITKEKYDVNDIPSIIKIFKYGQFYKEGKNIYYNSFGDEISNADESSYYSKIESVQDSVFHLTHFLKNNVKVYDGYFTSFFPHNKEGYFSFYYPNGTVRRSLNYENNKPQTAIEYFENGKVHRVYDILKNGEIIYKEIYDLDNASVNVLDGNGNGSELFLDGLTGKKITYEYKDKKLKSAYFLDSDGGLIYQLCENNAEIKKLKNLQKLIKDKLPYPVESLQNNNHGYVLVKCMVEPTGLVSEISLIKELNSDCDTAVLNLLPCFKTEIYWKPGKENNQAVKQEIIVPVDFSIITTSSYRNNYYNNSWFFNNMMQQQMMMQQQQWMNQQMRSVPMGRF